MYFPIFNTTYSTTTDPQVHLTFLASLLGRVTSAASNSKTAEANVLLLATIARAKLLYGDMEGTKTDMEKAGVILDTLEGVDNGVNAAYYEVSGDYYKVNSPRVFRSLFDSCSM